MLHGTRRHGGEPSAGEGEGGPRRGSPLASRISHDQNFKNLILDYPRRALEFFAGLVGAGLVPARARLAGICKTGGDSPDLTSSPESAFATIRHRSSRAKGCVTRQTMLSMIYKMGMSAEQSWRRLRGFRQLGKLIEGVKFNDGIEVTEDSRAVA